MLSSQKVLPSAPDNVKFFAEIFSEIEGSCGYFATFFYPEWFWKTHSLNFHKYQLNYSVYV